MKKITIAVVCLVVLLGMSTSCKNKNRIVVDTNSPTELKTLQDSISWALGFTLANTIASTGFEPNRELMFKAICATLDQKEQALTSEQTMNMLSALEQMRMVYQHSKNQADLSNVREQEAAYFAQLQQQNPNVKKSDKGFYYEVLKEGDGSIGEFGYVVNFDYKGTFTNGQIFDQTYGKREPINHVINETLMPGLREAFLMMKGGSKYRFYFPSEIGFGAEGCKRADGTVLVPPYTIVIYEIELHDVHP